MKRAEQVTFSGGLLDRSAESRSDGAALAIMLRDPKTRALPIWRGKPLMSETGLGLLEMTHPIFQESHAEFLFLGLDTDAPRFAADISDWVPDGLDAAEPAGFIDRTEQHHPSLPKDHSFRELRMMMSKLAPKEAEIAATSRALTEWHKSHQFCARCGAASAVSAAGWQRDCPACATSHFPRTDPVVIMLITHGNDVLMGRSHGWPEGMYSLLAGFVEPGESIEAAVRREVLEESGVYVGDVGYLASQPWPFPTSLMIGCCGNAASREITVDPEEIEDARWMSKETIAGAFAGTVDGIIPARAGSIANFLLTNWLADRLN